MISFNSVISLLLVSKSNRITSYNVCYTKLLRSISLSIEKQSTANTVEVSKKIKEELSTLEKDFPDIDFRILLDNSKTIQDSVDSVVNSALLGAVFALLILYVFLRNFRSTIIIGTAIPVSIIRITSYNVCYTKLLR